MTNHRYFLFVCLATLITLSNVALAQPQFIKQVGQVYSLVSMGGNFYFNTGNELWKTDGTTAGTVIIKQFQNLGSPTTSLTVGAGNLFFFANDGTTGNELWKSDGTTNGTVLVKDINPNGDAFPSGYTQLRVWGNDTLFFSADNGTDGLELWKSDGTAQGTVMVKDINPGAASSSPQYGIYHNGKLYFDAADGTVTRELFISDGTAAGTSLLKDMGQSTLNPSFPGSFFVLNNEVYFIARPSVGGEFYLHKTNGTTVGTNPVSTQVYSQIYNPVKQFNGNVFFPGKTTSANLELAKSDGSSAGTVMLNEINPSSSSNPEWFYEGNGYLFFSADDGTNGRELWKTDGTTATLVKDINTVTSNSSNPYGFTFFNNFIYFSASDGVNGNELWKTDGTTSGTNIVSDLNPGTQPSYPNNFLEYNNELYFFASSGSQNGLWKLGASNTGVIEVNKNLMQVYPNPTSDKIFVRTEVETTARISSITGTTLQEVNLTGETAIDVSNLVPGIYFIQTSTGQTAKFIKN
jgi:ELWxxDGT repeat protein